MKKVYNLTPFGKLVFTVYNILIMYLCYKLCMMTGEYASESRFYLVLNITAWIRILLTPFYMSFIWERC